jgi:hypothetical protein
MSDSINRSDEVKNEESRRWSIILLNIFLTAMYLLLYEIKDLFDTEQIDGAKNINLVDIMESIGVAPYGIAGTIIVYSTIFIGIFCQTVTIWIIWNQVVKRFFLSVRRISLGESYALLACFSILPMLYVS